jgi:hypothetical protein
VKKSYPAVVDRWAVIVGMSNYRHAAWNLKFADRDDANEFIRRFESDGARAVARPLQHGPVL